MKPTSVVQRNVAQSAGSDREPAQDQDAHRLQPTDLQELIKKREDWKNTGWATLLLAYGSLGVIYGDIGTSPLYAIPGIFTGFDPNQQDILGAISLIFWSITLIVLFKYVGLVLRANDNGEGGTFALYTRLCRIIGIITTRSMDRTEHAEALQTAALTSEIHRATGLARATRSVARVLSGETSRYKDQRAVEAEAAGAAAAAASSAALLPAAAKTGLIHKWAFPAAAIKRFFRTSGAARTTLLSVSVLATSMVVGDGVLTPAISVVSAVQGLTIKTPITQDGITGISIAILIALFMIQSMGTHRIAFLFSPMIIVWMLSILGVGIFNLGAHGGQVLQGLNPYHIVTFFEDHGTKGWESLGGVILCLTGCEALFADLGHFSIGAVNVSFCFLVYPCIILAYLGQGAYLLQNLGDVSTAFYSSVPEQFFWPMLVIATCSAVVASQALISGAFSIIRQATTLGVFPPLQVLHTGEHVEGQIYISTINYTLMLLSVAVVAGFGGDGTKIGNAYGIAVATVMLLTTCLMVLVMLVDWEISALLLLPFAALYLTIEGALLSANLVKIPEGGWFAVAVSSGVALVMFIWMSGQNAKTRALQQAKHSTSAAMAHILLPRETSQDPAAQEQATAAARLHSPAQRSLVTTSVPTSVGLARNTSEGRARGLEARSTLATRSRRLGSDLQPSLASASVQIPGTEPAAAAASSAKPSAWLPRSMSLQSRATADLLPGSRAPPPQAGLASMPEESGLSTVQMSLAPLAHRGQLGAGVLQSAGSEDPVLMSTPHVVDFLSAEQNVGLAKLRGVGVYYTDSQRGMPPVMWHLLRNVEAVHEVVVLLQNQFLPIPHLNSLPGVDEKQRFGACSRVAGIPHMYRVVARYGYQDDVDHGPAFMESVKEHIKHSVGNLGAGEGGGGAEAELDYFWSHAQRQRSAELQLLDAAYEQGVVYYLGRSRIRMKSMVNPALRVLHDLWYGNLYKYMSINAWDKVESWSIPFNSLVEIAMVLEI